MNDFVFIAYVLLVASIGTLANVVMWLILLLMEWGDKDDKE